jgi:hypothetical protein
MSGFLKCIVLSLGLVFVLPRMVAAQVVTAQVVSVGEIRTAKDAKIVRAGGVELTATVGTALAERDILVTGASGSVGFVLNDNSVITLGPLTLFRLNEFVFKPQESKLGIFGEILSGTMEYISGKISEISQNAVKFRTPYTTVAARGTRMLIRGDE